VNGTLSIIQCLRAPVGGLFRHVCDLTAELTDMGHRVGVICDSSRAGEADEAALRALEEICDSGVVRVAMSRQLGFRDVTACAAVARFAGQTDARIMHGHGAKGGAYARLGAHRRMRKGQIIRTFYTPHGGSLHYSPKSLQGRIFMAMEKRLGNKTNGLIFESAYSERLYKANVGPLPCEMRVIPNGVKPEEFYDRIADADAADFVFIGELRHLKGVDILLQALAEVRKSIPAKVFIAGGGPEAEKFRALARQLGVWDAVTFAGPTPASTAFAHGRCMVMPSRAESFPYVVLEAAAARVPLIATNVGGIPEIVAGTDVELIAPNDKQELALAMLAFLKSPDTLDKRAVALQNNVAQNFTVKGMAKSIADFYLQQLAND
jgi:glycosyltransferase involved in cell wall biosynthesis